MLAGYFSYKLAADVLWSKDFLVQQRARFSGWVSVAIPQDHTRLNAYVFALMGAATGLVIGGFAQVYSLFAVYFLFFFLNYIFERWRIATIL